MSKSSTRQPHAYVQWAQVASNSCGVEFDNVRCGAPDNDQIHTPEREPSKDAPVICGCKPGVSWCMGTPAPKPSTDAPVARISCDHFVALGFCTAGCAGQPQGRPEPTCAKPGVPPHTFRPSAPPIAFCCSWPGCYQTAGRSIHPSIVDPTSPAPAGNDAAVREIAERWINADDTPRRKYFGAVREAFDAGARHRTNALLWAARTAFHEEADPIKRAAAAHILATLTKAAGQ